jgi:hypothetical protein
MRDACWQGCACMRSLHRVGWVAGKGLVRKGCAHAGEGHMVRCDHRVRLRLLVRRMSACAASRMTLPARPCLPG